jgi:16S rRNA (cytidine1402-2'-O)-methyltransferase
MMSKREESGRGRWSAPPPVVIRAKGHPNLRGTHANTFELTTDATVTTSGTCIIGIEADWDRVALLALRGRVDVTVRSGDISETVRARINPTFIPGDPLIIRKHPDPQPRSLCIDAEKGSSALDRAMIALLRQPDAEVEVVLRQVAAAGAEDGALFVVATPIGNIGDLSPRAQATLRGADLIVAEDTRTTRAMLGRGAPDMLSLHDHNERDRVRHVLNRLEDGARIALVSEAGMPLISDPGFVLVRAAAAKNLLISPVPGPDSVTSALAISGLPADDFRFIGFPPRKPGDRRKALSEHASAGYTTVFLEAPQRLLETLATVIEEMGDRRVAVCRNMTKPGEEVIRGLASEVHELLSARDMVRGEFTVVIDRAAKTTPTGLDDQLLRMAKNLAEAGVPTKVISGALAKATGASRRDMFQAVLGLKDDGEDEDPEEDKDRD